MKIKNTSGRVISVGSVALLPDKDADFKKSIAELPAVKALIKKGFLTIVGNEKAEEDAKEKADTEGKTKADTDKKITAKK